MPELLSACLVIVNTKALGYSINGTVYVDVDGTRQAIMVDLHERPSEMELSVRSHLELLTMGALEQVNRKIAMGHYEPAPRPVEV